MKDKILFLSPSHLLLASLRKKWDLIIYFVSCICKRRKSRDYLRTFIIVFGFIFSNHTLYLIEQWDMDVTGNPEYDENKKWGLVRVSNIGRRAIYISHAALKVPKGHDHTHLVLMEGIAGKKLGEGDPSEVYVVDQVGLEKYKNKWRDVRAQANDTTGKAWRSKKLKRSEKPSWAG